MRAWAVVGALVIAQPAFAVPPVSPPVSARALVQEFVRATESNDFSAYAKLIAPDATITSETGASLDKTQWLAASSADFVPYRRTQFLNVFARRTSAAGRPVTRVVFVEKVQRSHPMAMERFPEYRSETITIDGGQIVHLATSGYLTHRLTSEGEWSFVD